MNRLPNHDELATRLAALDDRQATLERRVVREGETAELHAECDAIAHDRRMVATLNSAIERRRLDAAQEESDRKKRAAAEAEAALPIRLAKVYRCHACGQLIETEFKGEKPIRNLPCERCTQAGVFAPAAVVAPPKKPDPWATRWPSWVQIVDPSDVLEVVQPCTFAPGALPRSDFVLYRPYGSQIPSNLLLSGRPGDRIVARMSATHTLVSKGLVRRAEDQDSAPSPPRWPHDSLPARAQATAARA
jgi:hypothetical protein